MEQEARELALKVKALEGQKKSASDEAQRIIAAQRNNIETLRKENEHIQEQLHKQEMGSASNPNQDRMDKLYDLVDTYTRKIEVERRQLESLTQELDLAQAKAIEMRKCVGGPSAAADAQRQVAKQLKVLENRLELAEKKFSETLSRNKELRQTVEDLNKERAAFEQVQQKLEKELAAKRYENSLVKEAASIAAEAKAAALQQLETLRAQSDKEKAAFDEEGREQARCMEAEEKLLQQQAKRLERLMAAADCCEEDEDGNLRLEQAGGLSFDEVVVQLQEGSGVQHLGRLVQYYCCLEASNFEQFAACNAANERVSKLQTELRSLQDEIRQAEMDGVLGKQKDVIRQALAKRDQAIRRAQMFREKAGAMERRLNLLRAGISQVLRQLGCTPASYPRPQSASPSTTAAAAAENTNLYAAVLQRNLGLLESRSRAIIAVWTTAMGRSSSSARQMVQTQISTSMNTRASAAAAAAAGGGGALQRLAPHLHMAPPPLALTSTSATSPTGKAPSQASASGSADLESPIGGFTTYGGTTSSRWGAAAGRAGSGKAAKKGQSVQRNVLYDDDDGEGSDGSGSEDEMPMTREQIQSRLAQNQEAAVAALDAS